MLAGLAVEPRESRREGRHGGVDAALVAGLMAEGFEGRQIGMLRTAAVENTDAARGPHRQVLGPPVALWTRQAKRRDSGHDQVRVHPLHAVVGESDAVHVRWRYVVDQDVSAGSEFFEQLHPLGLRDIERDALLVGIEVKEEAALFRM